jgi:hypothetical protein
LKKIIPIHRMITAKNWSRSPERNPVRETMDCMYGMGSKTREMFTEIETRPAAAIICSSLHGSIRNPLKSRNNTKKTPQPTGSSIHDGPGDEIAVLQTPLRYEK